jgi:hypothetical protein
MFDVEAAGAFAAATSPMPRAARMTTAPPVRTRRQVGTRIERAPRACGQPIAGRVPAPAGVPRTIEALDERDDAAVSASRKDDWTAVRDQDFDDLGDFG